MSLKLFCSFSRNYIFMKFSLQCRRIFASERILIKRAPSWIQPRKRLGERRKSVLGSWSQAERRSNGGGGGEANMAANLRSRARIYDRELQYENACTAGYMKLGARFKFGAANFQLAQIALAQIWGECSYIM